jgi:Rieske Fe-S protein
MLWLIFVCTQAIPTKLTIKEKDMRVKAPPGEVDALVDFCMHLGDPAETND